MTKVTENEDAELDCSIIHILWNQIISGKWIFKSLE